VRGLLRLLLRQESSAHVQRQLQGNLYAPYDVPVAPAMRFLGSTEDLGFHGINFDAETDWDLTAQCSATENHVFAGGIANLLDTYPQACSDAGTAPANGDTFAAFFDALGRYVSVNLGVRFPRE